LYLDACNVSYETFFNKLSQLRFTQRQQEIMRQVKLPANFRLQKKLARDTALYAHKIRHQIRTSMLDIDKLKTKIDQELSKYLSDHQISEDLKPIYQDFADYVLKRALNPEPNPPLDTKPWQKSGIRPLLLSYINSMIYKIVHREQKKISRRKIPTTEKQKKMVIGFLRYRAMIEQLETEVHKLLNELQVPSAFYLAYKDFARECFANIKKLYFKDQSLLTQRLADCLRRWQKMKLDEKVLEKIKETAIKQFQTFIPKTLDK
ncbi:MAG: hypothetical protein ABIK33_02635, partial [candidate division WOR-3 bacterium]